MEPTVEDSQSTTTSPVGYKVLSDGENKSRKVLSESIHKRLGIKKRKTYDPFSPPDLLEGLDDSMYGSVAEGIKALHARKMQILNLDRELHQRPPCTFMDVKKILSRETSYLVDQKGSKLSDDDIIILEDDQVTNNVPIAAAPHVIVIDSDEEDGGDQRDSYLHHETVLEKPAGQHLGDDLMAMDLMERRAQSDKDNFLATETESRKAENVYDRACAETKGLTENDGSQSGEIKVEKETGVMNLMDCPERDAINNDRACAETKGLTENDGSQSGEIKVEKETGVMNLMDCAERDAINNGSLAGEIELHKDMGVNVSDCADSEVLTEEGSCLNGEIELKKDKGVYVGIKDHIAVEEGNHQINIDDDGFADIWNQMSTALECSKDVAVDLSSDENSEEECVHVFLLKEDIGDVCRVCGFVKRGIENIFDFQYKVKKSSRTYYRDAASRNNMDREPTRILRNEVQSDEHDSNSTEILPHPRHGKQMKPHQVEGFNFLVSNLMAEGPGGCILAHAPGSGKTFMMISFIHRFLAKYPRARVLVVLPKGILPTWRKEFETWKIEEIPLYDFYSVKADNRSQQLDILHKWVEQKSILFLGYKQFSTIVCDTGTSNEAVNCRNILLKVPELLILDEGHTSRNEDTDMFESLAKVNTPRRVVLSGTLYQNHVKEVFNILNLVRPRFIRLDDSSAIAKRIMSRVQISSGKHLKAEAASSFYEVVEHTLQKDENLRRRECVIQDLREMTSKVLHYYRGDFLDELPGLLDFTVLLNLSEKQKPEVQKLKKLDYFKRGSVGSLVYVHQQLKYFSENNPNTGNKFSYDCDEKLDEMLKRMDVKDGVKAKFFLNILRLCESTGEKLLVFSQYLLPLKFLERLAVNVKGWSPGKELFMISGESASEHREWSMERFNSSPDAKVFFGSIKACGEGISLVGASRILVLDVHVNPSVTRQAIGRAFRPGQMRKVYAYRLVAADSPEEEDHLTCFKKELISKTWFEYNEYSGKQDFKIKTVDVNDSGDKFLESPLFQDDIKVLYKR